jgi:hypothetical protein
METDLTRYKPNPSILESFEVDESLPDNELVFDLLKKLVTARKMQDVLFLATGKMLKIIKDRHLYRKLDFETFTQFLNSEELSYSKEKAYMYIRVWEYYCEFLELQEDMIKDLPVGRLSIMIPQLKKLETKEEMIAEVERAKTLRYEDFMAEARNKSAGDKPVVVWNSELDKYIVYYYSDRTQLYDKGEYNPDNN